MDESVEHEEEVIIEDVPIEQVKTNEDNMKENDEEEIEIITKEEDIPEQVPVIKNIDDKEVKTELTFNDIDSVLNENDEEQEVTAPKSLERLEEISTNRALQRKLDEISDDEEDDEKLNFGEDIQLTGFDVLDDSDAMKISDENILLNDVEVLE